MATVSKLSMAVFPYEIQGLCSCTSHINSLRIVDRS